MNRYHLACALVTLTASAAAAQSGPVLTLDDTPGARDSPGLGRVFTMPSAVLSETRTVAVVLPASFSASAPSRRYPVMVVTDGEASLASTAAVVDQLSRNGQMPEVIVAAIQNTNRLRDLTPPGLSVSGSTTREGGDLFLDFIERELLPELDRQFRGGMPRLLLGHSSGGILATYAAATRSTFQCVIALDAPTHLGGNWLVTKLIGRATSAPSALRYASIESRFGFTDATWRDVQTAAPASWRLYREHVNGESHESMPMIGAYVALRETFSDYSMLAAPVAPTTSILPYYERVGAALSVPRGGLMPPRRLLGNVLEDMLIEGRGADARVAYDMQAAGYGAPANSRELLAEISNVEQQPAPNETVEGLLATPFPTPSEAREIVGEWVGDVWMNEGELTPGMPRSTLRISVQNGKVVGETESSPAPGVTDVRQWTYLTMKPNGFSFGYMNGMRPRGVLVHDGTVKDGVLTGVVRFGGVSFTMPAGSGTINFAYRKK